LRQEQKTFLSSDEEFLTMLGLNRRSARRLANLKWKHLQALVVLSSVDAHDLFTFLQLSESSMKSESSDKEKTYELPDGNIMTV